MFMLKFDFFREVAHFISSRNREIRFPYHLYHRRNNCVFIHVPRSAGTSILRALGKKKGGRDHLPWYVYYSANPRYFKQAYKFAFVRNPWSRVFSAYSYLKSGGNNCDDLVVAKMINKYKDFDDFVVNGLGRGYFRNHLLFIPQSEFVLNGDGSLAVNFLGRYERLDEDFSFVAKQLSIDPVLRASNQGGRDPIAYQRSFRERASIEVVRNIYKQDALLFGYEY
jgi:hypothetical protein